MALEFGDSFGSNEAASIEGVWVSLGGDAEVKVARLGNPEAQAAYRKIPKSTRRQIEDATMSNQQSDEFLAGFMSKHIVKGWKNLTDGKPPKDVKFSEVNVKAMLIKYRRFRDRIWELAADEDLFNIGVEEDLGNSSEASAGT